MLGKGLALTDRGQARSPQSLSDNAYLGLRPTATVSGLIRRAHLAVSLSCAEAEAELRGHISRIFAAKRRVYGAPRIHAELRREGHRHARRRIERLMRDMGLRSPGLRPSGCATFSGRPRIRLNGSGRVPP